MDVLEACKEEMQFRRLSSKTRDTYLPFIRHFLEKHPDPKRISKKDIRLFLEKYKYSPGNTINVVHAALRFMMVEVLHKNMRLGLRYAKRPRRLPTCLTKEEVKKIIESIKNPKQRLIISLMYGAGLRVSEVVNLKPDDLDLDNFIGYVRSGKGNKDRLFIIPKALIEELKTYLSNKYLFMGNKGTHYSIRSVQEIIKKACKNSGMAKNVHPHTFRHSFATHLIEEGNSIVVVQALLGHISIDTTMVYLHSAKSTINVKSPLDDLSLS
ncbi:tyrosine-type recombinase/integrase [Candidatus Woesearchaeota archaeon]|nr:tyrosine-type recombinase/integrase [Candidatus Woesearchaeota archaeon]HIH55600.1 tyrosine-type recombinase/integrase [Candidatus Woesearchaeota archaeon]HIJ01210.1 tyrosine-type recombinase/integrase [Candidatus Woesearchaeota archaeon]HIJ14492.1 tyrosine-type recombinase/integrase [Candidatus Woesearchaeota archaeon]